MIRFSQYVGSHDCTSLRSAWAHFVALSWSRCHAARISYASLTRLFPVEQFRALQAYRKAISNAEDAQTDLLASMAADIRARLPDRPPRQRATKGDTYQI